MAGINYLAVVVAAVASMAVGMLWYGPLFGKTWMKIMGYTKKNMKSMKLSPMQSMIGGFILQIIMAFVLAHFTGFLASSVTEGAYVGFLLWLGFVMPVNAGVFLWENKPFKLFILNTLHYLVALAVMGAILAAW